jgi:glycosyltransferase involved in cell wall biosynthesis
MLLYKQMLEDAGYLVDLVYDAIADFSQYKAAITINIDRPYEPYKFLRAANNQGCPVAIYCLHHSASGFFEYLRYGSGVRQKLMAALVFFDPRRYEWLLTQVKKVLRFHGYADGTYFSPSVKYMQNEILKNCSLILTSCDAELLEIEKDFSIVVDKEKRLVVPHAYKPFEVLQLNIKKETGLIVCAGRVESRKNQLKVLKVAARFKNNKFIFVGGKNEHETKYFNEFTRCADKLPNVEVMQNLSLDEYRKVLSKAEVFISASWVEVVSLIEVDAYISSCKLVVGKNSYLTSYVNESIFLYDVCDDSDLENALRLALESESSLSSFKQIPKMEYEEVSIHLLEAVRLLISQKNP